MTVDSQSATAIIAPLDITLIPKDLSVTVDERWSPYCQADLTFAMPSPEDREALDLRESDLRITVKARRDFGQSWTVADLTGLGGFSVAGLTALLAGGPLANITHRLYRPWNGALELPAQLRDYNLVVTSREFDDVTQELRIEATSLESLLLNDALISGTAWNPGTTDLRTIVELVLARYGEALEPTSSTATVAEVDATVWYPGVHAWDYLDPMLEAASLRLWAGEDGVFRITARESLTDGAIVLSPSSMTEHKDTMTLGSDVWADAVVVKYTWTDALDLNNTAYDYAGTSPARAARLVKREGVVYPGAGAAAGILDRSQGRGRVLDVEAVNDLTATPGQSITINPPDTEAQTGYVSAVTWRMPDGEMRVVTRGLIDTPETSYLFGPVGASYLDVPVGVDYAEFDWSMV